MEDFMSTTVDCYGKWTPLATAEEYAKMEESEMSDMDMIAKVVLQMAKEKDYTIQTDIENVSNLIFSTIETYEEEHPDEDFWVAGGSNWDEGTTVEQKIREIIAMSGSLRDFDYRA